MRQRSGRSSKVWYKSYTVWFNFISVLLIVIEEYFELIKPLVNESTYSIIVILVSAINLYLRLMVTRPLDFRQHLYENKDNLINKK